MPHLRVEQPNHHFRNGKWKELTGDFGNFYFADFGKNSTGVDIVEGTEENVMDCVTFFPLTVRVPEDVDILYPEILPIEYEYVPLGTENVIVFVLEDNVVPLKVTDHEVPDGRPDSVKVTLYVTSVKVTDIGRFFPLTVNDPEDANGLYV